jgi:uncharacterized protein (TIGR00255 family)
MYSGGVDLLRSMTGYGHGEAQYLEKRFAVEIRAVNHRYREVMVRLPRHMMVLEDRMRKCVQEYVLRGRVEVYCTVEEGKGRANTVKVDKNLAVAYYKAMEEVRDYLGLSGDIRIEHLVSQPGLLVMEDPGGDPEEWWPAVEDALRQACRGLVAMRETEGAALRSDVAEKVSRLEALVQDISVRVPEMVRIYQERLNRRIEELTGGPLVDPARLAQEVAFFAERSDISEELVRLNSHLAQFEHLLDAEGAVGRTLDFLIQEIYREINTVGSKAQNEIITGRVVDFKGELEKIREQIQNIE